MKINMVRQTKMLASPLNVVKLAEKSPLHFKWTKNNKRIQVEKINLSGVDRHNMFKRPIFYWDKQVL